MKAFIALCVILALAAPAFGRTLDRCSLAREMSKLGVPRNELARWACIAEHVSSYRTGFVGPSSNEYGIFQINSNYWCNPGKGRKTHNACGVNCKALLTDNITKSVRCAKKILKQQGWGAWNFCTGGLASIDSCF